MLTLFDLYTQDPFMIGRYFFHQVKGDTKNRGESKQPSVVFIVKKFPYELYVNCAQNVLFFDLFDDLITWYTNNKKN